MQVICIYVKITLPSCALYSTLSRFSSTIGFTIRSNMKPRETWRGEAVASPSATFKQPWHPIFRLKIDLHRLQRLEGRHCHRPSGWANRMSCKVSSWPIWRNLDSWHGNSSVLVPSKVVHPKLKWELGVTLIFLSLPYLTGQFVAAPMDRNPNGSW